MESAIVRSVVKGVEIFEMDISEFSMDELLIQLNEILLFQQKNRHRILFFLIKIGKVPVSIKSIELCKKLILNMSLGSATAVYNTDLFRKSLFRVVNYTKNERISVFDTKELGLQFLLSNDLCNQVKSKLSSERP